jgi:hypothetical protein
MRIQRLITIFDNETELLKEEIKIDYIELNTLKLIFNPKEDDPLMYNVYEIKSEKALIINDLLTDKLNFDFNSNTYYVECVSL